MFGRLLNQYVGLELCDCKFLEEGSIQDVLEGVKARDVNDDVLGENLHELSTVPTVWTHIDSSASKCYTCMNSLHSI